MMLLAALTSTIAWFVGTAMDVVAFFIVVRFAHRSEFGKWAMAMDEVGRPLVDTVLDSTRRSWRSLREAREAVVLAWVFGGIVCLRLVIATILLSIARLEHSS